MDFRARQDVPPKVPTCKNRLVGTEQMKQRNANRVLALHPKVSGCSLFFPVMGNLAVLLGGQVAGNLLPKWYKRK